jgi:hypothetical protein
MKRYALYGFVFLLISGGALVSRYVWIGDIINKQETIIARVKTIDLDHIELIQLWAGDGYMTSLRHYDRKGVRCVIVGDGDAAKAWSATMVCDDSDSMILIKFNGIEWKYFYRSKVLHTPRHTHFGS